MLFDICLNMFQNNIPDFMTNAKKLPNVNMDNLLQLYFKKIFTCYKYGDIFKDNSTDLLTNQS